MVDASDAGGEMFEGELQQLRQKVQLLQADREFMQEEIQRLQSLGSAVDASNDERQRQLEQLTQQLLGTSAELATARTLNAKLLAKLQLAARALQLQRHALGDIKREVVTCSSAALHDAECIQERLLQAMQAAKHDARTRIRLLEEQLARQAADNAAKIAELDASRNSARLALRETEEQLQAERRGHAAVRERMQQLEQAMQRLETSCNRMRVEMEETRTHLAAQVARADAAEQHAKALGDAKERLAAQLAEQRQLCAEQTTQHAAETRQLRDEIEGRAQRIAELEAVQTRLREETAELELQAALAKASADRASQQLHELQDRLAKRDAEFAAQRKQLESAKEAAAEQRAEAQQAKASLGLMEKRYWKLTQDADGIRGKLVTTQSERDQLDTLCAQLRSQIAELEAQRQQQVSEALQRSQEVESLRQQLQEIEQAEMIRAAEFQEAVNRLQRQLHEKDAELERLQQMVISQCAERNSLLDELAQIRLAMHTAPAANGQVQSSKSGVLSQTDEHEAWHLRATQQGSKTRHRKNSRGSKVVPV